MKNSNGFGAANVAKVLGFCLTIGVLLALLMVAARQDTNCYQSDDCRAYQTSPTGSTKQGADLSGWKPKDALDRYTLLLAFFTACLVLVSVWQGYFLLRGERNTKAAADAALKAANAALAQAGHLENSVAEAHRTADEMANAAKAMGALAGTSKDTAERQLRAYLFVENAWLDLTEPTPSWEIRYKVRNFGATPASEVVVTDHACAVTMIPENLPEPNSVSHFGSMAPHDDFIECWTSEIADITSDDLTAERKTVVLVGRIDYVDAFKEPRWTKFCYTLSGRPHGDGEMDVYKHGNDHR